MSSSCQAGHMLGKNKCTQQSLSNGMRLHNSNVLQEEKHKTYFKLFSTLGSSSVVYLCRGALAPAFKHLKF